MTYAAPRATSRPGERLIETHPLRNPDVEDPAFMGRRGWWLVLMNVLVPGSAQVLGGGNRKLGRFGLGATLLSWLIVIALAVAAVIWGTSLVSLATNWFALTGVQVLLVFYALLWVVLTFDTLRLVRLVKAPPASRLAIPVVALLLLGLVGGSAAYGATIAGTSRGVIGDIFGNSGPSVEPSNGYYNILLLGADSGDGRDSMRFDSISVVSVNAESGAVTIVGIPRELPHAPFSDGSPMQEAYPGGFQGQSSDTCGWNGWMNHVRYAAEVCRDDAGVGLYPDAANHGSAPGIEATKDAAEGILGIEIPYYIFIDMDGFATMIDALGGVDITVDERLPKGGPPEGWTGTDANEWAIGWIETGAQHMDGDTAQWYARSRYTTDDWDRMERQRELQLAILEQFTPQNVLARFNEIAAAGTVLVDTDLPKAKLSEFFDLMLLAREQPVTTIELVPKFGVDEFNPDYAFIRDLVQQTLHPPTETPEPQP
ncbi:LCP family protein [uncultured Microbacterium sp.]|uniref:LCP family protein n=1 Tax=uncultured Microbacterium sp. TaxID=191216 RepID=UPI00262CC7D6|nr:LCP family protein [uncultured Microbacterium sp.]